MNQSQIKISRDRVSKHYERNVAVEYEKANRIWQIGNDSGFVASRPIGHDVDAKVIDYEFIDNMISLRDPYLGFVTGRNESLPTIEMFQRAGECLADIHRRLSLESKSDWIPSDVFLTAMKRCGGGSLLSQATDMPCAYLHGDFGFSNVSYIPDQAGFKIAIIDSSSDNYSTFESDTYAPIYLDLGHMAACIDGLVPIQHHPFIDWDRSAKLKESFVCAYEERSGVTVDRQWLAYFSYSCVVAKFHKQHRIPALRKFAAWIVYNGLKGNRPDVVQ